MSPANDVVRNDKAITITKGVISTFTLTESKFNRELLECAPVQY